MPRPAGSLNKDKPFLAALRLEINEAQRDENAASLRKIAKRLLAIAAGGDVQAIKEIADRLDGKPSQAVELRGDVVHHFAEVPKTKPNDEWQRLIENRSASGLPNPVRNLS